MTHKITHSYQGIPGSEDVLSLHNLKLKYNTKQVQDKLKIKFK